MTTVEKRSEHVEQREFVSWVRKNSPHKIFAIPNGGFRNIATAAKLKAEGVSAGVPDLFVPALKLFVEMKKKNGVESKKQNDWKDYLVGLGYICAVCYSTEDAKKVFIDVANFRDSQV
jgi:hypothetical protein